MPESRDVFMVALNDLQPSQLYISAEKLAAVVPAVDGPARALKPLPVRKLGSRLVLTDGHTRAVAAYMLGLHEVSAMCDDDDLDWEAYEICVEWCRQEGVWSIGDLSQRTVPAEEYDRLWLQRCAAMHGALAARRRGEDGAALS